MGVPLLWVYTLAAACCGGGMLWIEAQKQRRHEQQQKHVDKKAVKKRKKQLAAAASAGTASDIPAQEFAALQAFLKRVYAWRGWQTGSFHVTQAWHEAELAARTTVGGSWVPDFDGLQLSSANCDKLLAVIDKCFFAGKILKRLRTETQQNQYQGSSGAKAARNQDSNHQDRQPDNSKSSGRLRCKAVQADAEWLCYFDPDDNVIYVNHWRWNKDISPERPVNCEGVICVSRLQMLLHTLAHELVHAVVFHVFPEIDKSSPAYLPDDRHGPIFQLLNKQLYGHSSTALEYVRLLPCKH